MSRFSRLPFVRSAAVLSLAVCGIAALAARSPEAIAKALEALPPWHANSDQAGGFFGISVDGAGDVNKSGYASIIVAVPTYTNGQNREGAVFAWYGSQYGLGTNAGSPANASWRAEGNQAGAGGDLNVMFGSRSAGVGDVNGDGYADVLIGASMFNEGQGLRDNGKVFLYLGSAAGLQATPVWTASGDRSQAMFGAFVAGAGDVNGDGFADIIVGEPSCLDIGWQTCAAPPRGRVFVWFGGPTMGPTGTPSNADWSAEFPELHLLSAVAGVGDVNGDGFADIAVGAPWATAGSSFAEGIAYVWYGSAAGLGPAGTAANADWTARGNALGAFMGRSIAGGDVNGDGISDIVVGASGWDNPEQNEGAAFLWLGSPSGPGPAGTPDNARWRAEGDQESSVFGWSVDVVKDFSGDGHGDILVGAWQYDRGHANEGAAFIWNGGPTSLTGVVSAASAHWSFEGNATDAYFGYSAADAGDLNGDGGSEIVAGAYNYPNTGERKGRAFVFYGTPASRRVIVDLGPARWDFWRYAFEICFQPPSDPFAPFTGFRSCFPDPMCTKCWESFDRAFAIDPAITTRVLDLALALRDFVGTPPPMGISLQSRSVGDRTALPGTGQQFERLDRALGSLQQGDMNRTLVDSTRALVRRDRDRERLARQTFEMALLTLNAAEVNARSAARAVEVPAGRRTLVSTNGLALSFRGTKTAGSVTVNAVPGVPAGGARLKTAWPVAHFVVDYKGQLERGGHVTIDIDVRSLGFDARDPALRLLEWDGKVYRDVTTGMDRRTGMIRGVTEIPRTYLVASLQPRSRP